MSLYGALFTGVAGLNANSRALSVTSTNIANVNTVGYKASKTEFETLIASKAGSDDFSTGGVKGDAFRQVEQQGDLQTTSSSTDLAISGNGLTCGLLPPMSGCEWHAAQLSALKRGPRPLPGAPPL